MASVGGDDNTPSSSVQLGFALPLLTNKHKNHQQYKNVGHRSFHWGTWDGGKIGGQPSWLNPRDLPHSATTTAKPPLRCRSGYCCHGDTTSRNNGNDNDDTGDNNGTILQFIAQLYCPADDDTKNDAAFHRTLYIFACPTCCATIAKENYDDDEVNKEEGEGETTDALSLKQQQRRRRLSSCIRVLRCQLPQHNEFYMPDTTWPYDEDDTEHAWLLHTSEYWARQTNTTSLNLCAVCGQRSTGKCPKQQLWFCGVDHQKECLRASKERMKDLHSKESDLNEYLPSVYHEYELVVEDEPTPPPPPPATTTTPNGNSNVSALFSNSAIANDDDDDANLEQSDLNAMVNAGRRRRGCDGDGTSSSIMGVTDPITLAFYDRLAIGGTGNNVKNQCLRYCRWPEHEREKRAVTKKEKKKLMPKTNVEGGDGDGRNTDNDEEDVGIGPLWLSSRNRPPTHTTAAAAAASSTNITYGEHSSTCPPCSDTTATNTTTDSFPPPCQYCGAPRSFEFQIMPQMLYYLLHSSNTKKTTQDNNDNKFGTQPLLSELDKAILFEGQSKIENGLDNLPPGFVEAHGDAMKSAREALLGVGSENEKKKQQHQADSTNDIGGGRRNNKTSLDWGTIAVYTCTASCGNGGIVSKENGAYMDEVAWLQPPL